MNILLAYVPDSSQLIKIFTENWADMTYTRVQMYLIAKEEIVIHILGQLEPQSNIWIQV